MCKLFIACLAWDFDSRKEPHSLPLHQVLCVAAQTALKGSVQSLTLPSSQDNWFHQPRFRSPFLYSPTSHSQSAPLQRLAILCHAANSGPFCTLSAQVCHLSSHVALHSLAFRKWNFHITLQCPLQMSKSLVTSVGMVIFTKQ